MRSTHAPLRALVALALGIGLAACQQSEPETEAAPARPDIAAGQSQYQINCSTCHGDNGEGVEGLGKSLRGNAYVKSTEADAIVAMIQEGRPADHPQNSTRIAMPPNGGNMGLTASDLRNIVAFLKTL